MLNRVPFSRREVEGNKGLARVSSGRPYIG